MRKVLLLSLQPPGCSGVQARRYAKLLPGLPREGWEMHVVGPDPGLIAERMEGPTPAPAAAHYTTRVVASRRWSVRRSRLGRFTAAGLFCAAMQVLHRLLERLRRIDGFADLQGAMVSSALAAHRSVGVDLIVAVSPDFRLLESSAALAAQLHRPFVACYDDPHGHRDQHGFSPAQIERQRQVLDQAARVVFASPLTQERYIAAGLVDAARTSTVMDCFLESDEAARALPASGEGAVEAMAMAERRRGPFHLVHLGNIPPWRPLTTVFQALLDAAGLDASPVVMENYGFLYGEAREQLRRQPKLADHVRLHRPVSLERSHQLAETADALLVLVGPRHIDNIPSKFFEYLAHPVPILVIGPPGNPLEHLVADLQVGRFADVNRSEAIHNALCTLISERASAGPSFRSDIERRRRRVQAFGSRAATRRWGEVFNAAVGSAVD